MNNTTPNTGGLVDVLRGDKPLQFSISLDILSVSYLIVASFIVGILLIIISKKIR